MIKPRTVLPDTNTILRYLLQDHAELYERALKMFEEVRCGSRRAIVLESVLTECLYVLTKFYGVPRGEAADKLQGILRYKGIHNSDRDELLDALDLFKTTRMDIVACILRKKSEADDREPFSFDDDVTKKLSRPAR